MIFLYFSSKKKREAKVDLKTIWPRFEIPLMYIRGSSAGQLDLRHRKATALRTRGFYSTTRHVSMIPVLVPAALPSEQCPTARYASSRRVPTAVLYPRPTARAIHRTTGEQLGVEPAFDERQLCGHLGLWQCLATRSAFQLRLAAAYASAVRQEQVLDAELTTSRLSVPRSLACLVCNLSGDKMAMVCHQLPLPKRPGWVYTGETPTTATATFTTCDGYTGMSYLADCDRSAGLVMCHVIRCSAGSMKRKDARHTLKRTGDRIWTQPGAHQRPWL